MCKITEILHIRLPRSVNLPSYISWYPTIFNFDHQRLEPDAKKYFCEINLENKDCPRKKVNISWDVISVDVPKADRGPQYGTFNLSFVTAKQLTNNEDGLNKKNLNMK